MLRETWNVIQLGIGMCLVFFAFTAQGFIVEKVLKDQHNDGRDIPDNAGYYSQTVIYGTFIISNIIAPPLVKLFTPKWSLVIGSSAYTVYMVGFQFLNVYYLFASAAFEGLCAGLLWTSMGHYLALNSNEKSIGRNSGVVWLIYTSSFIFGGIFLLAMFGNSPDTSVSTSTMYWLFGGFAIVCFLGNVVFALLPNPKIEDEEKQEPYYMELEKSLALLKTTDILLLIFPFAYSGMELSFYSGVYAAALAFTKQFSINTNRLVALNSIAVGIGQLVGGSAFGLFGDRTNKFGRYPIILLGAVVGIIAYVIAFINLPGDSSFEETTKNAILVPPSIPLALIGGGLLGFADACLNTQIYSLVSMRYEGQTRQAFALHKLFHALLATACMFYGSVLQIQWQLLILTIGTFLSTIAFIIVDRRYMRTIKEKKMDKDSESYRIKL